jgi:hypothetical protein
MLLTTAGDVCALLSLRYSELMEDRKPALGEL